MRNLHTCIVHYIENKEQLQCLQHKQVMDVFIGSIVSLYGFCISLLKNIVTGFLVKADLFIYFKSIVEHLFLCLNPISVNDALEPSERFGTKQSSLSIP